MARGGGAEVKRAAEEHLRSWSPAYVSSLAHISSYENFN